MMFDMPGQDLEAVERDLVELGKCDFDSVDYYYMSYYAMPKEHLPGYGKGTYPKKPRLLVERAFGTKLFGLL